MQKTYALIMTNGKVMGKHIQNKIVEFSTRLVHGVSYSLDEHEDFAVRKLSEGDSEAAENFSVDITLIRVQWWPQKEEEEVWRYTREVLLC